MLGHPKIDINYSARIKFFVIGSFRLLKVKVCVGKVFV